MHDHQNVHVNRESIRIRFINKMKKQLFQEKERTSKNVSEIVRRAVENIINGNFNSKIF